MKTVKAKNAQVETPRRMERGCSCAYLGSNIGGKWDYLGHENLRSQLSCLESEIVGRRDYLGSDITVHSKTYFEFENFGRLRKDS